MKYMLFLGVMPLLLQACSIADLEDLSLTVTGTIEVADHMVIIHHKHDGLMGPKR